jgi:hypothetical protein
VLAGPHGVVFGEQCDGTVLTNCLVDGGMPPWYFRSDRKDGYDYLLNGATLHNGLGETTVRALLEGVGDCTETTIRYCEFSNGHDLLLFGMTMDFSRNWVHNLNDEALYAETRGVTGLKVHENVIEQCLSGLSFAADNLPGNGASVYRNLFDLRRPTAGVRPRPAGAEPAEPLRLGQFFKGNFPDGRLDLFHNTVLVKNQTDGRSSLAHLNDAQPDADPPVCPFHPRRSFNNIFVTVNLVEKARKPISWLPNPTWPAATDGNCYFRTGEFAVGDLFRHFRYAFPGITGIVPGAGFPTLEALRAGTIFKHSRLAHPPGYEASSIAEDPRFRSVDPALEPAPEDDLRLRSDSPCRQGGVVLPEELRVLDGALEGDAPTSDASGWARLRCPSVSMGAARSLPDHRDGKLPLRSSRQVGGMPEVGPGSLTCGCGCQQCGSSHRTWDGAWVPTRRRWPVGCQKSAMASDQRFQAAPS